MQVYKFGGASIATPDRMEGLMPVIQGGEKPLILVVSALGKTTNALEAIVNAAFKGDKQEAHKLVQELEQKHLDYAKAILSDDNYKQALAELNVYFTELQWAVDDVDTARYDYSYDQIVCIGELLSTKIFALYLNRQGIATEWVDIRDVIRTDETFRDAVVDWDHSTQQAQQVMGPILKQGKCVMTQGFIGSTQDNASATLGREGSDYTAAMLAAMLNAEAVTIWKDVEGLQNADPKEFQNTVKIEVITYHEVIEMAYYGAQVIHPKTIKPLQNNGIPLYVKCFLDRNLKGTVIRNEGSGIAYPPLIVNKQNQVLIQATTKDFSFITEYNLSHIYQIFSSLNIKINMIQNAAISFIACIDNREDKVKKVVDALQGEYKLLRNENVNLLTIRHYTEEILFDMTKNKIKLLEQKTRHTVQVVTM